MLKKVSKIIVLCMVMAFTVFMFGGCGGEAQSEADADTLVISTPIDTGNLNPHTYNSPMWIQTMVYEGLTDFDNGEVKPGMAQSWDITEDGREYTFHLRSGNVFSDGTAVTADIVKKNFDAVLAHRDVHNWVESINQMQEVVVIDENTVKIILKEPFSSFLQELSLARPLRVGAEAIFPGNGDTGENIKEPIGSGMWLQKEYVEGQYTVFERNDKYWGEKPSYKFLKFSVIPDINTAVSSLKAGEIDLIYDIEGQMTGDAYNDLEKSGYKTISSEPMTTNNLLLNTSSSATKDLNVRLALEYATDKKAIADNVFYGLQTPADTLMSTQTPYCDIGLTPYDYNLDKAKSLLDESGWKLADGATYRSKDGKELAIDFIYLGDNDAQKNIGQVLQNQYQQIGIKVNLLAQEKQTYGDKQKSGEFGMLLAETWGDPFDPHSYLSSFRNPSHGDYAAQVGLPMKKEIDNTINKALNSTDTKMVQESYDYVLRTLHEQAVYVPITFTTKQAAFGDNISKVRFNTLVESPFGEIELNK
ncbi:MAG: nickel ABC transporter substrate-binding protein [Clostridiales bacterium]